MRKRSASAGLAGAMEVWGTAVTVRGIQNGAEAALPVAAVDRAQAGRIDGDWRVPYNKLPRSRRHRRVFLRFWTRPGQALTCALACPAAARHPSPLPKVST
ncbi:hypothetical protein GCM10023144_37100 [Pigmentiphaga soli]|uniref:Uncharacterized protein n=1 Tax=Pigmentiphaga soli TaxID=1007095 RepID=A0ABP8HGV0_9BURK